MASAVDEFLKDSGSTSYADLCKICLRTTSKYICPKCNTPYCSLDCYKSELHLECSETFYQEWVENELKNNKVSVEGKRKMLEILNRFNCEGDNDGLDSDDDEEELDLADRLSGVDLDNAGEVWDKLNESEKSAFQELLKSGEVANLIPSWEPWWVKTFIEPKVRSLESNCSQELLKNHKKYCPFPVEHIKPFSEITKRQPSKTVVYDLINILGGYSLVIKYYNGDHFDFQREVATLIYNVSQSMSSPRNFSSFEIALEAVGLKALVNDVLETDENQIFAMKNDVRLILNGPLESDKKFYVLAALSDIRRIFQIKKVTNASIKYDKLFKAPDIKLPLIDERCSRLCVRRIDYFLSWSKTFDFHKLVN